MFSSTGGAAAVGHRLEHAQQANVGIADLAQHGSRLWRRGLRVSQTAKLNGINPQPKLHNFHFNAMNLVCQCRFAYFARARHGHDRQPPPDHPSTAGPARTDADWLAAHWMPYTGNREFKANPRLMVSAKGAYYTDMHGKQVFDGLSGLWCTGLGHGRDEITRAVAQQMGTLDYSPAFQFGHPLSFELANAIVERMPAGLNRVFFTGSGSESADTSLKMARAYWRTKGQASKTRLIGRVKGYHGVNFGGISVGGIVGNRKLFGQGVEADHLPTRSRLQARFSKACHPPKGRPAVTKVRPWPMNCWTSSTCTTPATSQR